MKRANLLSVLLLASVASFAQVHGVAPSVTSYTGHHTFTVAPSVTSVGPRGWQTGPCMTPQCVNPAFTPTINFRTGTVEFNKHFNTGAGHHPHHHGSYYGYGYGYTYAYPVYVPVEPVPEQYQEEEQPDAPAPTVFENRRETRLAPNPTPAEPSYSQEYLDQQSAAAAPIATPGPHNMSPVSDEQIPVVIIFKDGHQQEIQNYAIVGDTLYDLGVNVAHKIKLGDLDLKQTIEKNEQRGVDFNIPAGSKPVG